MNRIILLFISMLLVSAVFAEGKIVLSNSIDSTEFDLKGNLFYLLDTYSEYDFNEVLSEEFNNKFTQAEKSTFYYENNAVTQWYKLQIENQSEDSKHLVLSINNPLIQKLTIFSSNDSVFYNTGALYPYHQRQVEQKNFIYEVHLEPGESSMCCIRIEAQDESLYVPFTLVSEISYYKRFKANQFFNGLFYALVAISIVLLIVLWRTEKQKFYLYFIGLALLITLLEFWRSNVLFSLLFSNFPEFNQLVGKGLLSLALVAVLLFVNQIFNITRSNTPIKKAFLIVLYLSIVFVFAQYFIVSAKVYGIVLKVLSVVIISLMFLSLWVARNIKSEYIKPFSLTIILLAVYIFALNLLGYSTKGIGIFDIHITRLLLLLMFFVVGNFFYYKFKASRSEVSNLSKNLEHLVEQRTVQLNSQKEELKSQHEELLMQKETLQTQREELRAQKELLEIKNQELEKLSLVASKTDNLIYIFKPDGELDWFNSSFSLIIGFTFEEYKRKDPLSIVDLSMNKNIRHVLNTCLREKTVVSYESVLKGENGESNWYHTTLTPILDKNDEVRLLIAIDTNISKLKQYEDELNDQRQDAEQQKNLAIRRKEELEEHQTEITDSIRYAKRIQTAIMPKVKQIQRDFPESFVLFLPKDIVSGDFYWYHRIGDKYFIAAVDCTGHGVPGAFMSIIGNYLLNSIIIHNGVTDPAEILKQLNRKIKIAMKTDGRSQTTDGMDISVAVIDKNEKIIEYAGALRPMYMFNQGDFVEVKGDKIPITSSISGITIATFKTKTLEFKEGDIFYLFSDGIIDQFGGTKGKKFLTKRFKQLLFEINALPLPEQKELVKKAFDDWKGINEQVDDILVMGIKS